jgi:hypothetical protein
MVVVASVELTKKKHKATRDITANVPLLPSNLLEDNCKYFNFSNLPKLLGISPVMRRNARETSRGRQNGTSLAMSQICC